MKTICIALAVITLPFSCHLSRNESNVITGTYARTIENELYTLYDTVRFSPVGKQQADTYLVTQWSRTQFKKPTDQKFNKQSRHLVTGTFDPQKGILQTADPGITYSFDSRGAAAMINDIHYQKIK